MSIKPNILVIRQLALGDVLLTTPIIKQLYFDYSGDCNIDVLTLKPEALTNNPYVSEVFTPHNFHPENKFYQKTINLDLAYENYPNMHIIEAYAKCSHGSIAKIKDTQVGIFTTTDDDKLVEEVLAAKNAPYLVIHMRRDTWPSRNLEESTWKAIVDGLLSHTELNIIQIGSNHEISFDYNPRLINLLGRFTIQQLKTLISKASFYLGIDSGTLHVAASTSTPIISIFTSAHHQFRKPLGRGEDAIFIPITPDLACYGCQVRMPPPITGVVCPEGDPYSPPCKSAIPINAIINAARSLQTKSINPL